MFSIEYPPGLDEIVLQHIHLSIKGKQDAYLQGVVFHDQRH